MKMYDFTMYVLQMYDASFFILAASTKLLLVNVYPQMSSL